MMDVLTSYLPPHPGWLPKWLLFVSLTALGNSIQAYVSLKPTRQVYLGPAPRSPQTPSAAAAANSGALSPVTPLSARTFGTWTLLSAIVRFYGAYHINDPVVYQITAWTYAIAAFHFVSEWLVFGTARLGKGLMGPLVVSSLSLVWMWQQYGYYVQ